MTFSFRRVVRRTLWKTINAVVGVVTVFNVSFVGTFVAPKVAEAADTGYLNPSSNATLFSSDVENPANAYTENDADAIFDSNDSHKYGMFGVTVLADNVVSGIEIKVRAHRTSGSGDKDITVYVSDNDGSSWGSGESTSSSEDFGSSYSTATFGGPTDLWGRSNWTPTELNDTNFAVRISENFGSGTVGVDHLEVKVFYAVQNPPLQQTCGLDIGLVVDRSESVDSGEMSQMKTALKNFALAFDGTPTVFSLTSFATDSTLERDFSRTPLQIGSNSGDIDDDIPNDSDGHTNWDSGLGRSFDSFDPRPAKADLIVITTDGSPNRRGYPATVSESLNYDLGLTAAINRANVIKTAGTRIVVVGIGEDTDDPATPAQKLEKMKSISGPTVATTPGAITTSTDVIKVTDFNGIGSALSSFAHALCPGSITVNKQVDRNFDNHYEGGNAEANQLGFSWTLDGGNQTPMGDTLPAQPDNHSVNETVTPGYEFVGWFFSNQEASCSNPQAFQGTTLPIPLSVEPDQHLDITLCNRLIPVTTIGLDKQGPTTVTAGNNITYTLAWSVGGNAAATNATMTDPLPANTTFVSADNGGTYSASTNTVTWNLGTKNPGDSGTVGLVVKTNSPLTNGTVITNTGTFDTDQTDPVSDTVNTTVQSAPTIALDKQGPTTVTAGNNITYTLAWSVGGNAAATNATMTDPLPANTTFVSADSGGTFSAGVVTWNLGTKNPGDSGTVSFTVKSNSPLATGTVIANTGSFDTDQTDPVSDSVNTTVSSLPVLGLTKKASPTTVNPLSSITYTVNWSVAGNANATNVVITDPLPTNVTFVSAADAGVYHSGTKTITWNLGAKSPGASGQVTWVGQVSANAPAGQIVNTASIDSSETDPAITANATVNVVIPVVLGVSTQPDLTITKLVNKQTAKPAEVVTYTIEVTSTGTEDATNVVVTDTLPKNLSFANASGRTKTWDVGTLRVNETRVLTVEVRVESDAKKGDYVNAATAIANEVEQKLATATLTVVRPKVLGLATTGTGLVDYLFFASGLALAGLGVLGMRRRNRYVQLTIPW